MWGSGAAPNPQHMPILNAPGWAVTDLYDIEAKAETDAPPSQMNGPMLQKLLESRFNLKIHSETKELPIYALTVARNGIKLTALKRRELRRLRRRSSAAADGGRRVP
jgi:uncharacterized protein (TIGR03435 family)